MISTPQKLSTFLKQKVNGSTWLQDILRQARARQCLLCAGTHQDRCGFCPGCQADLPWLQHGCRICGVPLPWPDASLCANCLQQPPCFDRCEGLFHYAFPVQEILAEFKFRRKIWYAPPLGKLMVRHLQARADSPRHDLIVPTPLHSSRLRERGFNQALELAKRVSRGCGIPLDHRLLEKVRATAPQSSLSARERATNLRLSYRARGRIEGARVLLIDDIVTTGHTADELSRVLKQAGASYVEVLCVARTPPGR